MNNFHFTADILCSLHQSYVQNIFTHCVRKLLGLNDLTPHEQQILKEVLFIQKGDPHFLKFSFIIYLGNYILETNDPDSLVSTKNQLFLELALLLSQKEKRKIPLVSTSKRFSSFINQHIPVPFDSVAYQNTSYTFFLEGKEIFSTEPNTDSIVDNNTFLLIQDTNPYNKNQDHPDLVPVSYDLGTIPFTKWVAQFQSAYSLISTFTPTIYEEITPFLDSLVPHGYIKGKQNSSSFSKSPGILYLSFTDDDITQAEALIHEVHHTIYNIIDWTYPLLKNERTLEYYSPYRPDARHLHGCFLGVHAFVAVQNFYAIVCSEHPSETIYETFLSLYLKNKKTLEIVKKYAQFSHEGTLLYEDICKKHEQNTAFFEELQQIHPKLVEKTNHDIVDHFTRAKENNKVLHY